ncbi:MAG: tRNA preQ1(34) S-adenosylmethionine ribosyltransferase-isomerase QueA [Thalassobaculales bacterium]
MDHLLSSYDYPLPEGQIALRPAVPRESARLLRVAAAGLADHHVGDLPELLAPGDLLVFNDTRVIPARLSGHRGTVGVTVQLHQPLAPDAWRVFARPGKRLRPGDRVDFAGGLAAEVAAKQADGSVDLRFGLAGPALLAAIASHGAMPLPPYIRRPPDERDRQDYQTIFAARDGAVAAPTANLHITPALLARLERRGIAWTTVTLHVGAGTFLPVKAEDVRQHRMHAEWGEVTPAAAAAIAGRRGRLIAVGTTALRVLEASGGAPFAGEVDLFIRPGYRFRMVDMLLTNFHLPRSTLLMLVAALAGREAILAAYAHAAAAGYRFYSYGDACLIDRVAP